MKRTILLSALLFALPAAGCGSGNGSVAFAEAEETAQAERPLVQDRFMVTKSAYGFDQTMARLLEALDRRELTVFAIVDHAAGAEDVGAALAPTTLVIFGNPRAGTPLINAHPLMGAELPLKALVYERDGETHLALTGIGNLQRAYPLSEQEPVLDRIKRLTADLAKEVTAN